MRKEQLRGAVDSFKQSSTQVFQVYRFEVELLVEHVKHVKLQKDLILFKKGSQHLSVPGLIGARLSSNRGYKRLDEAHEATPAEVNHAQELLS